MNKQKLDLDLALSKEHLNKISKDIIVLSILKIIQKLKQFDDSFKKKTEHSSNILIDMGGATLLCQLKIDESCFFTNPTPDKLVNLLTTAYEESEIYLNSTQGCAYNFNCNFEGILLDPKHSKEAYMNMKRCIDSALLNSLFFELHEFVSEYIDDAFFTVPRIKITADYISISNTDKDDYIIQQIKILKKDYDLDHLKCITFEQEDLAW